MSNPAKNCRWITGPGTYCEAAVKYRMVEDGGEPGAPKVRSYSTFCAEHEERSAEVQVELEDTDELSPFETAVAQQALEHAANEAAAEQTLESVLAPHRKPLPELTPEQAEQAAARLADDQVVASAIQAAPLDADRVEQCRRVRVHADWAAPMEPAWAKVFDMTDDELVPLFGRSRAGDTAIRKVEQHIGAQPIKRAAVSQKKRDDEAAPEIELQREACPVCRMEKTIAGNCDCTIDWDGALVTLSDEKGDA